MQPIPTNGAMVYRSLCHDCEPAEMAELIKMSFGIWTWAGPRNHVLGGVQILHANGQFWGKRGGYYIVWGPSSLSCAKTTEPIEMAFGVWSLVDPMKHALDGVYIGNQCVVAIQPCIKLL